MRILVTGGSGYIGSVLVGHLLQRFDCEVTVVDNLMYRQDSMLNYCGNKRFDFIYGDVRDLDSVFVRSFDVVIPLAAIVGMPACEKDKNLAHQVNFEHVAKICSNLNSNQMLLFPQTNSGYGLGQGDAHCTEESPLLPISTYGKTKCAAESRVIECGGIAFRLATVFGVSPRMRLDLLVNDFTYKAATDGYVVLFEKDFKRNYIHVRDVAQAFCHMIVNYRKYQGQAFNVGLSDANISKWELCQKIKEQVPCFSIQVDEIGTDPDKRNYIVSNEKLEKTGWKPEVSLEAGIAELLKAYKVIPHVSKRYANA